jgi:hypothetical protein
MPNHKVIAALKSKQGEEQAMVTVAVAKNSNSRSQSSKIRAERLEEQLA